MPKKTDGNPFEKTVAPVPSKTPYKPKRAAPRKTARPKNDGKPLARVTRSSNGRGGRSSNPKYHQLTAYIPSDLNRQIRAKLLLSNGGDMSGLVEDLLTTWNRSH